ncbi:hypothetical protein RSAG8_08335, partial [Rhizoctonia solani AG-8 WAC10335]
MFYSHKVYSDLVLPISINSRKEHYGDEPTLDECANDHAGLYHSPAMNEAFYAYVLLDPLVSTLRIVPFEAK